MLAPTETRGYGRPARPLKRATPAPTSWLFPHLLTAAVFGMTFVVVYFLESAMILGEPAATGHRSGPRAGSPPLLDAASATLVSMAVAIMAGCVAALAFSRRRAQIYWLLSPERVVARIERGDRGIDWWLLPLAYFPVPLAIVAWVLLELRPASAYLLPAAVLVAAAWACRRPARG